MKYEYFTNHNYPHNKPPTTIEIEENKASGWSLFGQMEIGRKWYVCWRRKL